MRPDHSESGGYRVMLKSSSPTESCLVLQGDHHRDIETLAQGVIATTRLCEQLVKQNIIGQQLQPPFDVNDIGNKDKLIDWIKHNHFTVFHWGCTCQAGINGKVCDETFRLKRHNIDNTVVPNLFIGSAASLPELPEANPHLTITAFTIALAEVLSKRKASIHGINYSEPIELSIAKKDLLNSNGLITIRREGEEVPSLLNHASLHYHKYHKDIERN